MVKLQTVESAVAAMMSLVLTLAAGTAPVIGTVVARGVFRLDNATVNGNATLFEGATIETNNAASRMELSSGAKVSLGIDSKAKFYGDRMILEKGQGQLEKAAGFRLEARGLTIQPETGNASARVALAGGERVELAALSGTFRVLSARGILVANVGAGRSLALEPQTAEAATRVTGTLRQVGGHYLLTDETTNVTVELAGAGLAKEVGNRIAAVGVMDPTATPVTDASQFIRVSSVTHLGKGDNRAAGAGAGGAGGAGVSSGIALSATTIAVIGGVAAAATLGGLAAAGKLPGQGSPSSISR